MYKYYNRNPEKEKLPDCVCRAISLATNQPYEKIWQLLEQNGLDKACDDINLDCYSQLLADMGFRMRRIHGRTVRELAHCFPYSRIIVRIEGHLTCCIDGVCYDIWDCTRETADCYWVVK